MRRRIVLLALAISIFALPVLAPAPARAELTCGDLPDLTTMFFQKHILFRKLDDELRQRTARNYLESLDPQRVLFVQSDVKRLEDELSKVFHEIRAGDCSQLRQVQQEVIARHREAEGFVRGFVGSKDYALDEKASLVLDPAKRGYPATKKDRDALLRSLVHFQISNYLAADMDLAEARQRLIHRYELRTRRAEEVTRTDMYASFLDSFARALDPHSSYLSADYFEDFRIRMELSLEGIGVALSDEDGYSVVEQIIPGGAADRLDALQPGDKIIAVAEEGQPSVDVIDMALRDVVRLIRGPKGTRVRLTVLRQADKTQRFQVAIVRDKIDLQEEAAQMHIRTVEDGGRKLKLAVLELPSFYGDGGSSDDPTKRLASRDVRRLLMAARREKVDGLLLDLSRNGGGLLDDAVRISGFFIKQGGIVAVRDASDRVRIHRDPDDDLVYGGPMVILTSRVSASASEILAGALKDYHRAVIVGDDHTFGKGTVQSMIPLGRPDLGALKVTTGIFFRPGGASTQDLGVASDVVLPSLLADDRIGERAEENALPPTSIEPFVSPGADGSDPLHHWTPVTKKEIAELARRSQVRVAKSKAFKEIDARLAERKKDQGRLTVAELETERKEGDLPGSGEGAAPGATGAPGGGDVSSVQPPSGSAPAPHKADKPADPHVEEGLHVLADLVLLES